MAGGNIRINAAGVVKADGGAGWRFADGALKAGSGGGGGGGALRFLSGGSITLASVNVTAIGGAAGSGSAGGDGGIGASGRTLFLESTNNYTLNVGTLSAGNPPPSVAGPPFNEVGYADDTTYTITSKSYDTQSALPDYLSPAIVDSTPAGTSITYEFAGSSDNFVADDSGFVSLSNISLLNGKRYLKYRVTLATTDREVSPTVTSIAIRFDNTIEKFSFQLASCASVHASQDPFWKGRALWTFAYLVLLLCLPTMLRPTQTRWMP